MKKSTTTYLLRLFKVLLFLSLAANCVGQDSAEAPVVKKVRPVKNTFGGVYFMDDQNVIVPIKRSIQK